MLDFRRFTKRRLKWVGKILISIRLILHGTGRMVGAHVVNVL